MQTFKNANHGYKQTKKEPQKTQKNKISPRRKKILLGETRNRAKKKTEILLGEKRLS